MRAITLILEANGFLDVSYANALNR